MYIEDKGIVLKCVKYDDKSFIAHLFTAHHGHLSFIVSGGRSKRSSMNARLFAPLSFVTFQCDLKPNTTLQRIKEAHALFVQQDTPYHPVKRSMAMLLGEFMAYALREETENKAAILKDGEVLLLENLRFHKEEEENDFTENWGKIKDLASDINF